MEILFYFMHCVKPNKVMYVIRHVKSTSTKRVLVSISLLAESNVTHTVDPKINK
jgi:uncharacterized membrane protein YwaF